MAALRGLVLAEREELFGDQERNQTSVRPRAERLGHEGGQEIAECLRGEQGDGELMFAKPLQRVHLPFGAPEVLRNLAADRAATLNDVHVARIPHVVERRLDCL